MVNVKRVRKKLCSLLCNDSTTLKLEWARRHRIENGLTRLKKHNPQRYIILETRLMHDLEELERAIDK